MKQNHFTVGLVLALILTVSLTSSAFAQNYKSRIGNVATFETLEEAELNAPAAIAQIDPATPKTFATHPDLAAYPAGTTYIYRSSNMYGSIRAAAKQNTALVVFCGKTFTGKDEAKAYITELGIIDLIESAGGSIVLVTPSKPETGFGAADQKAFQLLQNAMMAQKSSKRVNDENVYYPEGEYFGVYGYQYIIGIDEGATFVNNYIASSLNIAGRVAGMALIGGTMQEFRKVACPMPVYLANASEIAMNKYMDVNCVNASSFAADVHSYFNQDLPLQKVVVADKSDLSNKDYLKDAYENLLTKAMRVTVTGGTLPYSLCTRCAVIDGKTPQNVLVNFHFEDRFSDVKTDDGEYLQSWYECLPAEVLDGTAEKASIPLILCLHGMGDDPLMFVDEIGLLELAGKERIALVAPEHQTVFWTSKMQDGVEKVVMPMLVEYMLATYPALDPSRVFVTGYSMGGWATMKTVHGKPGLFAAAVPMSGMGYTASPEEAAQFDKLDLPFMLTTSTADLGVVFDEAAGHIGAGHQTQIMQFMAYNGINTFQEFDFVNYPMNGFKADSGVTITLNGEYINHRWFINNDQGIPMIGLGITEGPTHALYPEFAKLMWDFAEHYSRDQATGAIIYNP